MQMSFIQTWVKASSLDLGVFFMYVHVCALKHTHKQLEDVKDILV